jgi:hypothetical protein
MPNKKRLTKTDKLIIDKLMIQYTGHCRCSLCKRIIVEKLASDIKKLADGGDRGTEDKSNAMTEKQNV